MGTTRKWVYVAGSGSVWGISESNTNTEFKYSVSQRYHPDYVASNAKLHWNTGNGYRDDYCINANGSSYFNHTSDKTYGGYVDIYIGAGTPQEASSVSTTASAWVGLSCGIVYGAYATQQSNAFTISENGTFTEYAVTAATNKVKYGTVNGAESTSYKYVNSTLGKLPNGLTTNKLPTTKAATGCSLLGWYYGGSLVAGSKLPAEFNATAIFAPSFTVSFNSNGGLGTMDSATYYGDVEDYVPQGNISKNTFKNSGWLFVGWDTEAEGGENSFSDGASASSIFDALSPKAGSTVTLYAQWRRPTVYVVNSNTSYGTLKLYKGDTVAAGYLAATEANGVLAADVSDGTYTIVCEQGNILYRGAGVGSSETSIIWPATQVNGENTTTFMLSGSLETTFFYEKNGTYKVTFDCSPADGGSAIIHKKTNGSWPTDMTKASDADETVDGVPKWVAQTLRFVVIPATGYDCASLHVVDAVDGTSSQPAVANPPVYPNSYTCDLSAMDDDVRVDLIFTKQRFDVEVGVDDASASVGVATVNDSDAGVSDVEYGTSVTYKATFKDGVSADDYRFEGWYLDGLKISEDAEFAYEITKAVRIVAKFAAKFAIGVAFTDNRADTSTAIAQAATLVLNGTTYEISASATNAAFVVLGASASWTVTPGANWYFNAFYAPSDTAYANALEYERIGLVAVVSEATHIVARLTTVKIQSSAVVKVHVNDPATDVPPDASDPVVTASGFETAIADDGYSFTLDGTGSIAFTAKATVEVGGVTYAFNCFATDVPTSANHKVLSREISYKRTLNSPKMTIYALYGAFAKVGVSVAYGSGSDRTMGTLSIDDETNEESGVAKVTKNAEQGTTVTVKATAKNGYRFYGWYFGGNVSGEPDETSATLEVFVTSERTILAAFEKARDAVYEWEGSSENKMMEWKSKVYVAARPFNPSALRVDTNGYPVGEMRVGMFSAPDAEETAVSVLKNVASQDSRRLPKRRPERYIQVTVKNDQEVDRILVGTSMEGVSV